MNAAGEDTAQPSLAKVFLAFLLVLSSMQGWVNAAEEPAQQFVERVFRDESGDHRYVVFVPRHAPQGKLPVVLFLHGAGEKGVDGRRQLNYGFGTALEAWPDYPAYVVFPQCEDLDGRHLLGWRADRPDAQRALKILDEVIADYPIDAKQQSLCGWSMGGYGAWSVAAAQPNRWTSVVALSGGGEPASLKSWPSTGPPIWAIHGVADSLVPVKESEQMMQALLAAGGNGRLDQVANVGHDVWRWALSDRRILNWLLKPTPQLPEIDWSKAAPLPPHGSADLAGPFRPHIILPGSVALRLGNEALNTMGRGIPAAIPKDSLVGHLDNVHREVDFQGKTYVIQLNDLSYAAKLAASDLKAISGERFRVRFWLEDLTLKFGSSRLEGDSLLAKAGPFEVVIGHRRPVLISLELRPEMRGDRVHFAILRQKLSIPDDNWYISRPTNIESFSDDLPVRYVETGLVGGLYRQRHVIEQQVLGVVPELLNDLSERIESRSTGELATKLWPLPVLAPDSRLLPGRIRTDSAGISVELNLAAAFPDRPPVNKPEILESLGTSLQTVGRGTQLQVQIDWNIIGKLSEQYARHGSARVHVLDLPEPRFHKFADPEFAAQLLPAGTSMENVDVLLQLASPMTLLPVLAEVEETRATLMLSAAEVQIVYVRRTPGQSAQQLAQFTLPLKQPLNLHWNVAMDGHLRGNIEWGATPDLQPIPNGLSQEQLELFASTFRAAWVAWAKDQSGAAMEIPPIEIGSQRLSPLSLEVLSDHLEIPFGANQPTKLSDSRP